MLVNEVVETKAIAYAALNDPRNAIDYLGRQFFPDKKINGLDLKWIRTSSGAPVTLAPSNFDTLPVIRARGGLDIKKTQMAFFRESMRIDEEDAIEIDRIKDETDPYLQAALQSIYDDTNTLVRGAEVVPERMIMQLLATTNGHPTIGIQADGVNYAYDYDTDGSYASKHYLQLTSTGDKWSDTSNSNPITDLMFAKKALNKIGKTPRYALMTTTTFNYLLNNKQVKGAVLAQSANATVIMTDAVVKQVVKTLLGLDILIYDKVYVDEAGNEQQFYPDNKVTLLPDAALGATCFGTTPEERTARQCADVDVTMYKNSIAIAKKVEYGPPAVTSVTVSEITLPSYEGMDSTFVIEVA